MNKVKNVLLVVMTVLVTIVSSANLGLINVDASVVSSTTSMQELATKMKKIDNQELSKQLENVIHKEVASKDLTLLETENVLEFEKLTLSKVDDYTIATIPYKNSEAYNIMSNLSVVFDASGNIINYSEQQLTQSDHNTFWVKQSADGHVVLDKDLGTEYLSNTETLSGINELKKVSQTRGLDLKCFGIVAGAGAAVCATIAKLCGTPCALTAVICGVCVGGIIVIGGGSIVGAIVACWK
ncbi:MULTISPECIES: hypothetical protein [Enterococcus]|uniref:hypothetical protein n=1 Tax=Enterococcus TaxID=1350 RepID=UPI0015F2A0A8|nr:hypothetical protein [Enterococcus hirae]MBA5267443.1 hypothetical protein [Enterococcus hirae]MEB5879570.1 hypothetical protein [Enterococcus hirae]MEB5906292.1 hypothetical protein [Enterococcus hirae]